LHCNYSAQNINIYYENSDIEFVIEGSLDLKILGDLSVEKNIINEGDIYIYGDSVNIGSSTSLFEDFSQGSSTAPIFGKVFFNGDTIQNIYKPNTSLSNLISFNKIEINNSYLINLDNIILNNNIDVFGELKFTKGNLQLDGNKIFLRKIFSSTGTLNNETNDKRIIGFPGEVYLNRQFSSGSLDTNLQGIGLGIKFEGNLGTTKISRFNKHLINVSDTSYNRNYKILPANGGNISSPIFKYFDGDLTKSPTTSIIENQLAIFYSFDQSNYNNIGGVVEPLLNTVTDNSNDLYNLSNSNNNIFTLAETNCDSLPFISIDADTISICDGASVYIVPDGIGPFMIWSNGDVTDSIEVSSPGKYSVSVIDSRGCENSDSVEVVNATSPNSSFSTNPTASCLGSVIEFTYSNPDNITNFNTLFNFNDPNSVPFSDTSSNVISYYTYVYDGTFNPSLTITNEDGCSSTTTETFNVYPIPTANFNFSDQCLGNDVVFNNLSTIPNGITLNSRWNFDTNVLPALDTNIYGLSSISNNYLSSGIHPVSLTVSSNGCSNTLIQNVEIHPVPSPSFNISSQDTLCPNESFVFLNTTDTAIIDDVSFVWDFGNNNLSSIFSTSFSYGTSNDYPIQLTAISPFGCRDSTSQQVVVSPIPIPNFSFTNSCEDSIVLFLNALTDSSNTYLWDFGDGYVDSIMNPNHAYFSFGTNDVKLVVNNIYSCSDSITKQIEIFPNPISYFPGILGCESEILSFNGSNSTIQSGSIVTYSWKFGDGNIGANVTANHSYTSANNYLATLNVISDKNCTNSYQDTIQIIGSPPINLGGTIDLSIQPDAVPVIKTCGTSLNLYANNPGCDYSWYNPLLFSVSQNVTVNSDGIYSLTVKYPINLGRCSRTDSVYVKLNTKITPNLGSITSFCDSANISSGYPNSLNEWFLNDTLSSSIFSSTSLDNYQVNNSGFYFVKVTDLNNCIGVDSININVNASPEITLNDTVLCEGLIMVLDPLYTLPGASYQWYLYEQYDAPTPPFTSLPTLNTLLNIDTLSSLSVDSTYQYFVEIIDVNGCKDTAESIVVFDPVPLVDFGVDTSYCDSVLLIDSNIGTGYSYEWQDGSTNSSFLVDVIGNNSYSLQVTLGNCSDEDTLNITLNSSPDFNLGNDTILCSYQSLFFDVSSFGDIFNWNTGSTLSTLDVYSSGIYKVEVGETTTGCSTEDSISVTINPVFQFDLGADEFICEGSDKIISSDLISPGYNFNWSNNVPDTTLANNINNINDYFVYVDTNSTYYLDVTDTFGCFYSDTINILETNLSLFVRYLIPTTSINSDSLFYNRDSLLLINLSYPYPYNTRWEVFEQLRNNSYIKIWGADTNAITIYNNGPYFDGTEPDSINRKIKLTVFNSICSAEKTKDITVYKDFSKNLIYNPPVYEYIEENNISGLLYPNPNSGLFNLKVELDYEANIQVLFYNTMGVLLAKDSYNSDEINNQYDFSSFQSGVYIVLIRVGEKFKTIKFIKL
tara:strand:+ start:4914 stop:9401 length:4488 start_codon:yes stop_codon:yes gene_type:complete